MQRNCLQNCPRPTRSCTKKTTNYNENNLILEFCNPTMKVLTSISLMTETMQSVKFMRLMLGQQKTYTTKSVDKIDG